MSYMQPYMHNCTYPGTVEVSDSNTVQLWMQLRKEIVIHDVCTCIQDERSEVFVLVDETTVPVSSMKYDYSK